MMGPSYYYYDSSFIEDVPSADFHVHDCMWSGECYVCQPARMPFCSSATPANGSQLMQIQHPMTFNGGTIPINVGGSAIACTSSGPFITLTTSSTLQPLHQHESSPEKLSSWSAHDKPLNRSIADEQSTNESIADCSGDEEANVDDSDSECEQAKPDSPEFVRERRTRRGGFQKGASKRRINKRSCVGAKRSTYSSNDVKKLRHREVEKHRHRQLQTMVKTLSEKIPGKLDKETQVQTMKRAARYCVYLREVANFVSQNTPDSIEGSFERIYQRSCDIVTQIIIHKVE